MANQLNIYVNYNEDNNNPPKLWASTDDGLIYYGSCNRKNFATKQKDRAYFIKTSQKKLSEGYYFIGVYPSNFFEKEWGLIHYIWSETVLTNQYLTDLANAPLAIDFFENVIKTTPKKVSGVSHFIAKFLQECKEFKGKTFTQTQIQPEEPVSTFTIKDILTSNDQPTSWAW